MSRRIFIRDFRLPVSIGIHDFEKDAPQTVVVNVELVLGAVDKAHGDRIANVLCPLLASNDVLLDLHSFHTPGEAFAMLGPRDNSGRLEPFAHAQEEEAMAVRLGPRRMAGKTGREYAGRAQCETTGELRIELRFHSILPRAGGARA